MKIGHPTLYLPPIALKKAIAIMRYTKLFSTPSNVFGMLSSQKVKAISIKFCMLKNAENAGMNAHVALNNA